MREIADTELNMLLGDQWGRITVVLKTIGNKELSENLQIAWFTDWDDKQSDIEPPPN
jgi:hypothetical protein